MSTSPDELDLARRYRYTSPSELQAVADELLALVEEFEAAYSEGRVPPAFAERLAELRQTAERLIDR